MRLTVRSTRSSFAGTAAVWLLLAAHAAGQTSGQVTLSEVLFDPIGVNNGRQVVEIHNPGGESADIGGQWLYFPPSRWQFPAGASVSAGGHILVHLNVPGKTTPTDYYTGISGMRDLRAQDAIALFRSSLFGDAAAIIDFVQWGSAGNGGEDVAVQAGIWGASTFVDVSSLRDGSSIAYDGSGHTALDWCVDGTPTLGAPNEGCSPSFVQSAIVLSEVGYVRTGPGQYHPAVEFRNVGDYLEDLGGKVLALSTEHTYEFPRGDPDTLIAPGEIALVHLGVGGTSGPLSFYSGAGTFRDFLAQDSVSLHVRHPLTDATSIVDFVQWGGAGAPLEGVAVGAGIWTAGEIVVTEDLRPRGSLASFDEGLGAARWTVDNTPTLGKPNDDPPVPPVVINEILVDPPGGDVGAGAVELLHVIAEESFDASGLTLCSEPFGAVGSLACFTVPSGTVIPPRGILVVRLNVSGPPTGGIVYTGPFPDLDSRGGVLLLSLTPRVDDVNNLVDYVRWGTGSTTWEAMADSRHLWPGDEPIFTDFVRDSTSIAYLGNGDGAEAYRLDSTPSIGEPNEEPSRQEPFRRGDCNDDGDVDISDAIKLFTFLFLAGGKAPFCEDACDSNDDADLDISDPIFVLNFLFRGGHEPPLPGSGAACGPDSAPDALTCNSFLSCPQ